MLVFLHFEYCHYSTGINCNVLITFVLFKDSRGERGKEREWREWDRGENGKGRKDGWEGSFVKCVELIKTYLITFGL